MNNTINKHLYQLYIQPCTKKERIPFKHTHKPFMKTDNTLNLKISPNKCQRIRSYKPALWSQYHNNNTDEPQIHYIKWKKIESKATYGVIMFRWHSGKSKTTGAENKPLIAKGWSWERDLLQRDPRKCSWVTEVLCLDYGGG